MGRHSSGTDSDRERKLRRRSRSRSSNRHRHKKVKRKHSSSRSRSRSKSHSRSYSRSKRSRSRDRRRRPRSRTRSPSTTSRSKRKKSNHKHRRYSSSSESEKSSHRSKTQSTRSSVERERPEKGTIISAEQTECEKLLFLEAVENIGKSSFHTESFCSSRGDKKPLANQKVDEDTFNFGTQAEITARRGKFIPLTDDCLLNPDLFCSQEEREEKYLKRIFHLRQKALLGEPL